jgi:hypothetical protein
MTWLAWLDTHFLAALAAAAGLLALLAWAADHD